MTPELRARLDALPNIPSPGSPLSARQRDVLALVAEGRTNREIARSLGLAEETVKRHVLFIRIKLDAPDRAAAVDRGWRQGYLP